MAVYIKTKPNKPKSRFQKIITKISIALVLFLGINYLIGNVFGFSVYRFYISIFYPENWVELFSYPVKKRACELKGGIYYKCNFFWYSDCGCKMPGEYILL